MVKRASDILVFTGKKKSYNSHMYSTDNSANAINWGVVSDSMDRIYTHTNITNGQSLTAVILSRRKQM